MQTSTETSLTGITQNKCLYFDIFFSFFDDVLDPPTLKLVIIFLTQNSVSICAIILLFCFIAKTIKTIELLWLSLPNKTTNKRNRKHVFEASVDQIWLIPKSHCEVQNTHHPNKM